MKQPEHVEGPETLESFGQFARAILQAPKPKGKARKQPRAVASRKAIGTGKDYT